MCGRLPPGRHTPALCTHGDGRLWTEQVAYGVGQCNQACVRTHTGGTPRRAVCVRAVARAIGIALGRIAVGGIARGKSNDLVHFRHNARCIHHQPAAQHAHEDDTEVSKDEGGKLLRCE